MRGILIDPFTRSISEVDTSGKLDSLYALLGVDLITVVPTDESHSLILDDEGLLKPREEQAYFMWYRGNQPFAGKGLILGVTEEGDNADATVPLDLVARTVTFIDREFVNPEDYLGWTIVTSN